MKTLLGVLLLALFSSASAHPYKASFFRGECGEPPPDWTGSDDIRSTWHEKDSLEVVFWQPEGQPEAIDPESFVVSLDAPGVLRFVYTVSPTPWPKGAPVPGCSEFVKFVLSWQDLPRADYKLLIERRVITTHGLSPK